MIFFRLSLIVGSMIFLRRAGGISNWVERQVEGHQTFVVGYYGVGRGEEFSYATNRRQPKQPQVEKALHKLRLVGVMSKSKVLENARSDNPNFIATSIARKVLNGKGRNQNKHSKFRIPKPNLWMGSPGMLETIMQHFSQLFLRMGFELYRPTSVRIVKIFENSEESTKKMRTLTNQNSESEEVIKAEEGKEKLNFVRVHGIPSEHNGVRLIDPDSTCAICLEKFKEPQKNEQGIWEWELLSSCPNCSNCFHPWCIQGLLRHSIDSTPSCPACRGSLKRDYDFSISKGLREIERSNGSKLNKL